MTEPWEMNWGTAKPASPKSVSASLEPWEMAWDESPVKETSDSDTSRGFSTAFKQLPQLGYGLVAAGGATLEEGFGEGGIATGMKKAGVRGYNEWGDKIALDAKESDSLTYSWDKAKEGDFGALVDWMQYGLGYAGGQAVQMLASGGVGYVAGKTTLKTVAEHAASSMVKKEAALIAEKAAASGAALSADAIQKAAIANVAGKIGQTTAIGAQAFGMEGGEIGGDLVSQAEKEGRSLTGAELAQAFGATLGAGALEFVGDKIGLDLMLGKSSLLKPAGSMTGFSGRAARATLGATAAAPIEGGTEYGQTLIEEWGKGKDPFSDEARRQAFDAAGLGAIGGAAMGGGGGLVSPATRQSQPAIEPPIAPPVIDPIAHVMSAPSADEAIARAAASLGQTAADPLIADFESSIAADIGSIAQAGLPQQQTQDTALLDRINQPDAIPAAELQGLPEIGAITPESVVTPQSLPASQAATQVENVALQEQQNAQAAPPTQPQQSPAAKAEAPVLGEQVSFYPGQYGKGMNKSNAKLKAMQLNQKNTDKSVTYTAEEHSDPKLEYPWAVVGRKNVQGQAIQNKHPSEMTLAEYDAATRAQAVAAAPGQPESWYVAQARRNHENYIKRSKAQAEKTAQVDNTTQKQGVEVDNKPGGDEKVDQIARRYAELLAEGREGVSAEPSDYHRDIARAIIEKDAYKLHHLSNGLNDKGKRLFEEFTGIKLPKQNGKTWEAIREWGGISSEEDAHKVAQANVNKQAQFLGDTLTPEVKEWANKHVADGLNEIRKIDGNTYLVNPKTGTGVNLSAKGTRLHTLVPYLKALIERDSAYNARQNAKSTAKNEEPRSATPEAESKASAPKADVAGVAPGQEAAAPQQSEVDKAKPASADGLFTNMVPSNREGDSFGTETSNEESVFNRVLALAKIITDATKTKSFISKGFSGLDIPTQSIVLDMMLRSAKNPDILNTIIASVPVDVMNVLTSQQISPDMLFHNNTMLSAALFGNRIGSSDIRVTAMNGPISAVAAFIAKVMPSNLTSSFGKNGATTIAGQRNSSRDFPGSDAILVAEILSGSSDNIRWPQQGFTAKSTNDSDHGVTPSNNGSGNNIISKTNHPESMTAAELLRAAADKMDAEGGKQEGGKPVATNPKAPVSSVDGQKNLANRGSRIASLKMMNDQIRKLDPTEAWHDSNIEDAQDLDSLQDRISQALVDLQRAKEPASLPSEAAKAGKIEDFGGTIAGNRKDRWKSRGKNFSPLSIGLAEATITRIGAIFAKKGWNVDLSLAATFDALPDEVKAAVAKYGEDTKVKGVVHKGVAYVVADEHGSESDLETTILHEVTGHVGVRRLYGKDITGKLGDLYAAIGGRKGLSKIAAERGLTADLTEYAKMLGESEFSDEIRTRIMLEEVLAHIAQAPKFSDRVKSVIGAIRAWLRENGFAKLAEYGETDLLHIVSQGRAALATVETTDGPAVLMVAYHGSPHDFDKFSLEHIGSGEGAQAYGSGLYFAGNKEVADYYRKTLGSLRNDTQAEIEKVFGDSRQFTTKERAEIYKSATGDDAIDVAARKLTYRQSSLRGVDEAGLTSVIKVIRNNAKGKLYAVELAPQEADYLLWDKPLSEQSEKVRNILLNELGVDENWADKNGKATGETLYNAFSEEYGGQVGASNRLAEYGVRGIKYLDGSSRDSGEGSFNYVIFSDSDVTVTAKFAVNRGLLNIERDEDLDPSPEESTKVQTGIEGKTPQQAAKFIIATGSEFQKEVAQKVLIQLNRLMLAGVKLDLKIAHVEEKVPGQLSLARGLTDWNFAPKNNRITVWINGADVSGKVGTSYETVLHELIHMATTGVIHLGSLKETSAYKTGKDVADLIAVTSHIKKHFNQRVSDFDAGTTELTDFEKRIHRSSNNALDNADEVLAWGLSNPEAQAYMESIPYPAHESAWTAFVSAIRRILGLSERSETTFTEILRIADNLMNDNVNEILGLDTSRGFNTVIQMPRGSGQLAAESSPGILGRDGERGIWETVVAAWNALGSDMAAYQNPTPDSFDMAGAASEIDPGMRVFEDKPDLDEQRDMKLAHKWLVKMPDGAIANIYENEHGEVWLNASNLAEGMSGGSKLYLLVGSYAEANGKVFIGDPAGLSDVALLRRTENMLSLALRFGRTDFMMPHEYQMNPEAKLDTVLKDVARPIEWVVGDDENNLAELLKTSYANTVNLYPGIKNVTFNFDKQRFEQDGREFTDFSGMSRRGNGAIRQRGLAKILSSRKPGAIGGEAKDQSPVGSATLKRAAITNTVSREARGGAGRDVLARISGLVSGLTNEQAGTNSGDRHSAFFEKVMQGSASGSKAFSDLLGGDAFFSEIDNLLKVPAHPSATRQATKAVDSSAASGKPFPDNIHVHTKALSGLLQSKPVLKQGLSGLDAETQREVFLHMLRLGHDDQILDSVVKLIPVDMVDYLRGKKIAPEKFFNDFSVFIRVIALNRINFVTTGDIPSTLVRAIALVGAEKISGLINSDNGIRAGNPGPASSTIEGRHSVAPLSNVGLETESAETDSVSTIIPASGQPGGLNSTPLRKILYSRQSQLPVSTNQPPEPPTRQTPLGLQGGSSSSIPEETSAQAGQRVVQDQFNRFKVLQDWLKEQGVSLSEKADVYLAETLMSGRISTRKQDFRENQMAPLIEKTQAAGVSMEQVGDYLKAQHAPEANTRARDLHGKPDATAYGMSDQDAKNAMDAFKALPNFAQLKALADEWQSITGQTKQILLDAGILSDEQVAAWGALYSDYVPVKGLDDKPGSGTGKGLGVNGRQHQRKGHGLRDEGIIENILRDHERAISLDEKNLVGHALIRFALEAKNPDIITVGKPVKRQVLKKGQSSYMVTYQGADVATFDTHADASVYITQEALKGRTKSDFAVAKTTDPVRVMLQASPMLADNEVNVYVAGHAVRVQINDEIAARAYTRMGVEHLNAILSAGREINTWLSKVYTGYSPDFIFTNPLRDATQGFVTLTGEYGVGMAAKIFTQYPHAVKELVKHFINPGASKLVSDYRAHGGSTGAAYLSDLERIGNDMQASYNEYAGAIDTYNRTYAKAISDGRSDAAAKTIAIAKSGAAGFRDIPVIGHFLSLMEHVNAITENALRVATYDTLTKNGVSKARAAAQAKNLMNFNRKGEASNQAGALYLFFNPNVQGTQVMYRALVESEHKGQARALAGMMVLSAIVLAELAMMGGDDDEDKWKNTPDHVKDGNLVIGFGDYQATLTLPYGYRVFHTLGNVISEYAHGANGYKLGVRMASSVFNNFSPVGNPIEGELPGFQLLPTLPKMLLGPSVNENSFGQPIGPRRWNEAKPDSQSMFRGTKGSVYSVVASGVNELTGGSKYEKGLVDVSPETLKYWVRSLTGGAGQFAVDAINTPLAIAQGVPTTPRDYPIARRFVREIGISDTRSAFWDRANEAKQAADAFAAAKKSHDSQAMKDILNENRSLISLSRYAEQQQKLVAAKRDAIDKIKLDDNLSLKQKHAKMKMIEDQEKKVYERFIKLFDNKTKH